MQTAFLAAGALLCAAACATASSRRAVDVEIRSAFDAVVDSLNRLDTEAFLAWFTDDATAFLPAGEPASEVAGLPSLRNRFVPYFARMRDAGVYNLVAPRNVRITRLSDDAALVTFEYVTPAVLARRTVVFRRTGTTWRMAHLHGSNFPRATPPAAASEARDVTDIPPHDAAGSDRAASATARPISGPKDAFVDVRGLRLH